MLRIRAVAKVKITATERVFINWEGAAEIIGGTAQEVKRSEPQDWCDYHGVKVIDGIATLYKALNKGFKSPRGGNYTPGTTPRLSKFQAEPECCADALYFSPTPRHAHQFLPSPDCYVACPVLVSEIVTHVNGDYPEKVKAIGCCAPVYEVDVNGNPINQESAA